MEGELSLDSILDEVQIEDLFKNESESSDESDKEETEDSSKENEKENVVEINPDDLFGESESVDNNNEDSNKDKEDTGTAESESPPTNFYSSIANALAEEGIFQNLDDSSLKEVTTPEAFVELVDNEVKSRLDERYKMIDEALSAGLEPSTIQKYYSIIQNLESVTDEAINDESEGGENLRKGLILQDYINKGFTKERAEKEASRSFKAGTDIEDAKEALNEIKQFYTTRYNKAVEEGNNERAKHEAAQKSFTEDLRKAILDDENAFGDLKVDRATRKRVYENTLLPTQSDPETGQKMTAIQMYEKQHRKEFLKNIGVLFTLTDGFKNLDALVQGKVKKEVKKGMRELEKTLSHTSRNPNGSLNFMSGISDPNAKVTKWELDI